jgi:hypothetical protein
MSQCVALSTPTDGQTTYILGLSYYGSGASCSGFYFADPHCTTADHIGPNFLNPNIGSSTSWTGASGTDVLPSGVNSILVECEGSGNVDQIYLEQDVGYVGF